MYSFFSYKKLEVIKTFFLMITVFFLCIEILIFQKSASDGAKNGLIFCSDILIPSLFPFMVLSSFIVKSGLSAKLGYAFNPLTKSLFNLPGSAGSAIIISLIGGYPTGAKAVRELLENREITQRQAERMLFFTIGAGPSFVIGVIGVGIFKSFKVGIIMFLSQIISSLLIGIIVGVFSRIKKQDNSLNKKNIEIKLPISEAFVKSCIGSTGQIINLCAFVVLFSSFISIINYNGFADRISSSLLLLKIPTSYANSLLFSLLEVIGGCLNAGNLGVSVEFISFSVAFAGICVHFQIFSTLGEMKFSKLKFMFFRLIHGFLSAIITHISFVFFPITKTTFAINNSNVDASFYTNFPAGLSLIILCIFFLIFCMFSEIYIKKQPA